MAKTRNKAKATKNDGATVGYETQLWEMADALRGSMEGAGTCDQPASKACLQPRRRRPAGSR
jgi:hypothetical protein